ncbi:hypothetical protein [Sphingomonas swuensis]|uniref:hypothetical protein n=1 Tax=Sphingomonas swuensis TaxID=977800 RepID=UPI0031CE4231
MWAGLLVLLAPVHGAQAATQQATAQQQPAQRPGELMDRLVADKLVWSTLIAIDQANRTGNYSVLRALGSESFQRTNSEVQLAATFRNLRANQVDLSNTLIISPIYEGAPTVTGGVLRAKGVYPLRPVAIGFDLLFEQNNGGWKVLGLFVAPLVRASGR